MKAIHKRILDLSRLFPIALLFSFTALSQTEAIDPGTLNGDTYTNRSLGFTFKLAPGFFTDPKALAEAPHNQQTSVLISAWQKQPFGTLRPGIILSADRLSYYPQDRRTAEAYVARVVRAQVADGYGIIRERSVRKFGNSTLICADFKKALVHEAICVSTRRGFALTFIVTGASMDEVDKTIRSTNLEFDKD